MTNENVEKAKADQSDSELELKAEEQYREYICRDEYKGRECGFRVRAKTDDEVIGHARMHQEMVHGVKEMSPEMDKKIKENIRPEPMTEMKEYDTEKVKNEEKGRYVEPIKPGDPRVARRKGSLLDTCYTTSSGQPKSK